MSTTAEKTVANDQVKKFSEYFFAPFQSPYDVRIGAASHVGKVRKNNEDHYVVVRRSRAREIVSTNLTALPASYPAEYAYTLIVADGVGGSAFGEFASQLALETALELAGNATSWVMKLTNLDAQQMRDVLTRMLNRFKPRYAVISTPIRICTEWPQLGHPRILSRSVPSCPT